jgi:hypothetical protein
VSEEFNPYYRWLAIPPSEQPANHYRLLGLPLFEANADVIDSAADRQMAHVRSHATGKHAADSQRILNELSKARLCLLNAQAKANYDSQLQAQLAPLAPALKPERASGEVALSPPRSTPRSTPSASAPAVPMQRPAALQTARPLPRAVSSKAPAGEAGEAIAIERSPVRPTQSAQRKATMLIGGSLGALLVVLGLSCVVFPAVDFLHLFHTREVTEAPPPNPGREAELIPDQHEPTIPEPPAVIDQPAVPQPVEPIVKPSPAEPVQPATTVRQPIPDAAERMKAEALLQSRLIGGTPQGLLQQAAARDLAPVERFVLLLAARDNAAARFDTTNAFQAVAELEKHFEHDVPATKRDTILKLDEALQAGEVTAASNDLRALAEYALPAIDQLMSRGDYGDAQRCVVAALRAARKTDDAELSKRVTLRAIELQNRRAPQ